MKTLAAAFKEVYGEALKEYGFKKVKGKYPYYARVIGDEIVHIITYKEEWCAGQNLKAFSILGGVATVYRKIIAFDENPKWNAEWLVSNSEVVQKNNCYINLEQVRKILKFEYEKINEASLLNALNTSLELTRNNLLKVINEVDSLKKCIKFYRRYKSNLIFVEADEMYIKKWTGGKHNEGLLCTKVYGDVGYEEYKEDMRIVFSQYNEVELLLINTGRSGLTYEEHKINEIRRKEQLNESLKQYEALVNEEWWKKMVKEELEQRKKNNLEILKNCGLI